MAKRQITPVTAVSPVRRKEEIRALEYKRMNVTSALEIALQKYAEESKNRKLKRRKHKVGKGPQDYGVKH